MRETWVAGRLTQPIEAIAQVAHEAVAVADGLGTSESLEAAHAARAPFEVLVVALDRLLLHLARDVLRLRYDGP